MQSSGPSGMHCAARTALLLSIEDFSSHKMKLFSVQYTEHTTPCSPLSPAISNHHYHLYL